MYVGVHGVTFHVLHAVSASELACRKHFLLPPNEEIALFTYHIQLCCSVLWNH